MKEPSRLLRLAILLFVVWAAPTGSVLGESIRTVGKERLLPFTYAFDRELRPVFDEKLLLTPANYGRMTRMHGGAEVGDSVVSVYCVTGATGDLQCQVTLTKAHANLDYVMAEHRTDEDPLRAVRQVPVSRKDAPIPESTAVAFRTLLKALLPGNGDHRLRPSEMLHNQRIEFWIAESGNARLSGEVGERPGKAVKALIRMGDLLKRYCEVAESDRPALAKQIENQARSYVRYD